MGKQRCFFDAVCDKSWEAFVAFADQAEEAQVTAHEKLAWVLAYTGHLMLFGFPSGIIR